jgi:hypothetical protein
MDLLSRIRSAPNTQPPYYQQPQILLSPVTPITAAKTRDPNAPDYRYQVNQKCIYERELPGGSYITAHLQRLQSGYYDSDVVHEDLIENVRFIAINFVFHPSRKDYRFKSAQISIGLHHAREDASTPFDRVRNSLVPDSHPDHDHATQTETVSNALVRSTDFLPRSRHLPRPSTCRAKFIRHAPHLLYGAISPETLDWNFNVAGSIGVSQGPASASLKPSYGMKSSYKVYEMMRIQGSVRTLRSWYGHEYDVEDGEIVWTLEENKLQKSGLPREFTFVMMLTKGSGGVEASDDITLDIDVRPKVSGPMGGTYPKFITGLHRFQPFRKELVDLDVEIGQVFEPSIKGKGFNFANLASNFDQFVWLPGTTYSTTDNPIPQTQQASAAAQPQAGQQQPQQVQLPQSQNQQQQRQITAQPSTDQTLNLRVILENARGSPIPINGSGNNDVVPYLQLKPPSRNPSPLPPSVIGSQKSHNRSITITSQAPASTRTPSQPQRHPYADPESQSRNISGGSPGSQRQPRQVSHTHSLRKTRSRSGLDKEYIRSESPEEPKTRNSTFHDARTGTSPQSPTQSGSGSVIRLDREAESNRGMMPRYGNEVDEETQVQDRGTQDEYEQDSHPRYQLSDISSPERNQRFPSLSQTHSQRVAAGSAHDIFSAPTQGVPQTPPGPSIIHSSQPANLDEAEHSRSSVADPDTEFESHSDEELSTPPLQQQQTSSVQEPSTPPPARNQVPVLDSSTSSWHQHVSSPPSTSIPSAFPIHSSQPGSINYPANATPRSSTNRRSLDHNETGKWNDTPLEWASPAPSGSNTPTRNRSIRTRKATARALAYQDAVAGHAQPPESRVPGVGRSASLRISASPNARNRDTSMAVPAARTAYEQAQQGTTAGIPRKPVRYSYPSVPASAFVPSTAASNYEVRPRRSDEHLETRPQVSMEPSESSPRGSLENLQPVEFYRRDVEGRDADDDDTTTSRGTANARFSNYREREQRQLQEMQRDASFPKSTSTANAAASNPTPHDASNPKSSSHIDDDGIDNTNPVDHTLNDDIDDNNNSFDCTDSTSVLSEDPTANDTANYTYTNESAQKLLAQAENTHAQAKLAQKYGAEAGYWGQPENKPEHAQTFAPEGGLGRERENVPSGNERGLNKTPTGEEEWEEERGLTGTGLRRAEKEDYDGGDHGKTVAGEDEEDWHHGDGDGDEGEVQGFKRDGTTDGEGRTGHTASSSWDSHQDQHLGYTGRKDSGDQGTTRTSEEGSSWNWRNIPGLGYASNMI